MVAEASSRSTVRTLDPLETNLTPFPKPTDHLRSRAEPSIKGSQLLNEPQIKVAPKPLRPMTSVVPENRERAPRLSGMVNQGSTVCPSFWLGQVQRPRKEQRSILNVKGELEQCLRPQRPKRLRCPIAVPDGLVVADARIVSVSRVVQDTSCVFVAQQPVYPDADPRLAGHRSDSRQLVAPFLHAMPGIDAVNAKLTPFPHESRCPMRKVGNVVGGRAARRVWRGYPVATPPLERDQEVCGGQILFDPQIPLEWIPEILRPP